MNDNWLVWQKIQDILRKDFTKKRETFSTHTWFSSPCGFQEQGSLPQRRPVSLQASRLWPSSGSLDVIWNPHFAHVPMARLHTMWPSPPNIKLDLPSPRAPWGRDSWPGGRSGSCTSAGPVQLGPSPWTWLPHPTSWAAFPRIGAMTSLVTAVIEEVVFSQAFLFCCVHFFEFDR